MPIHILITRPDLVRYPSTALAVLRAVLATLPREAWPAAADAWVATQPPPPPAPWERKEPAHA